MHHVVVLFICFLIMLRLPHNGMKTIAYTPTGSKGSLSLDAVKYGGSDPVKGSSSDSIDPQAAIQFE